MTSLEPIDKLPASDSRKGARDASIAVVSAAGGFAFGAAALCALFGWGWAGAVAACGISLMGAVAAFSILRYT